MDEQEEEKTTFVTDDSRLSDEVPEDDPRLAHADREILKSAKTGEGLIPIESAEELQRLAEMALLTKKAFDEQFKDLNQEKAEYVYELRMKSGYSWRAVAETCAIAWGGDWGSNQLAGMALCERAQEILGKEMD